MQKAKTRNNAIPLQIRMLTHLHFQYQKKIRMAPKTKSRLVDQPPSVRRLKTKYLTNVKDSEEPVFMKGQDYLVFEHSKRIWGAPGTSNGVSTNGTAKITVEVNKSSEPKRSAKVSKPKDDEKHKEEEKQVAVKEVVKEDIVKGDQQDFQSEFPHLTASFESMAVCVDSLCSLSLFMPAYHTS
uniref:Uncharacterized protein n=1 Tax=Solanum lycopersicum TaxID=4081 RepID=A0A3Q7HEN6_SOLLC